MSLSINQNIMAMNSYRNLSSTQNGLSKSLEKLSSGFRINRAADDAAGLAISEGLRSQVGGNKQAVRNAQDGISVVQTAEGALNEVHSILQRMRDLAVQGANDSNDVKARANIKTELSQLRDELERIGKVTNFNGTNLLNGSASGPNALKFQVGANGTTNDAITVDLKDADVTKVSDFKQIPTEKLGSITSYKTAEAVSAADDNTVVLKVGSKEFTVNMTASSNIDDVVSELQSQIDGGAVTKRTINKDGNIGTGELDANTKYTISIGGKSFTHAVGASAGSNDTAGDLVAEFKQFIESDSSLKGKYELEVDQTNGEIKIHSLDSNASPVKAAIYSETGGTYTAITGDVDDTTGAVKSEFAAVPPASDLAGKVIVSNDGGNIKLAGVGGADLAQFEGMALYVRKTSDASLVSSNNLLEGEKPTVGNAPVDMLDVSTHNKAQDLIKVLDDKIQSVSTARANLGAVQNRFEHTIANLNVAVENLSASESRIRDTDMAQEMMQFTRNQILSQAGTAMLAQANQVPQGVLSLLR